MIATLSQSLAELPKFVELASQGEDVLITVNGQPKAKLTRADGTPLPPNARTVDLSAWLAELEDLRRRHSTGKTGLTVEQILEEDRADRA
jgi:antitoxin (DNA-binding transcriptional repressor) of toxin-antitoxin stability system